MLPGSSQSPFQNISPSIAASQTTDGELLIAQLGGGGGANVSSGEYFYLPGLPVTSLKNGRLPLSQKVLWEHFLHTTSFLDKRSSYYYCITKYSKCKSVKNHFIFLIDSVSQEFRQCLTGQFSLGVAVRYWPRLQISEDPTRLHILDGSFHGWQLTGCLGAQLGLLTMHGLYPMAVSK